MPHKKSIGSGLMVLNHRQKMQAAELGQHMKNAKWILAMMVWAVAAIATADTQVSTESGEQLRGYQSELEATYKDAESSADATLDTLMNGIDRLTSSDIALDDMVAQVQR